VERLRREVETAAPRLEALVNNAGTSFPGPLELLPITDLRAQLEINLVAHLAVTQALLPRLRAARGTLVNVSSIGRIPDQRGLPH
jgi:NAD(P)-dependent dehydrogenase (short-subunit alcohol dehydrogenase family)